MKIQGDIKKNASLLYNFHRIDDTLERCDIIIVPCSHDIRVADYTAKLFLEGYGSNIVFSGGIAHTDDLLNTEWKETEAKVFATKAGSLGVPKENIILEEEATNTGENYIYSMKLLTELDIIPKKILIVTKPYMQKRALATFQKQYTLPYSSVFISAPNISFDAYPNDEISLETLIHILVGDTQRLIRYSKIGYQTPIDIPTSVMQAYQYLVDAGFTEHMIS